MFMFAFNIFSTSFYQTYGINDYPDKDVHEDWGIVENLAPLLFIYCTRD